MTIEETAIKLREWQAQIIHGPNVFGDMADAIDKTVRELKKAKERTVETGDLSLLDDLITEGDRLEIWIEDGGVIVILNEATLSIESSLREGVRKAHIAFQNMEGPTSNEAEPQQARQPQAR